MDSIIRLQELVDSTPGASVATVSGRYYAMDRDKRWDRTETAYRALTQSQSAFTANSALEALEAAYERGEVTDVAQVMLARQEAGVAFEATLQVRNKLLTAYQEIMRMGG